MGDALENIRAAMDPNTVPGYIRSCSAFRCPGSSAGSTMQCAANNEFERSSLPNTERVNGPIMTKPGSSGGCECIKYKFEKIN